MITGSLFLSILVQFRVREFLFDPRLHTVAWRLDAAVLRPAVFFFRRMVFVGWSDEMLEGLRRKEDSKAIIGWTDVYANIVVDWFRRMWTKKQKWVSLFRRKKMVNVNFFVWIK